MTGFFVVVIFGLSSSYWMLELTECSRSLKFAHQIFITYCNLGMEKDMGCKGA